VFLKLRFIGVDIPLPWRKTVMENRDVRKGSEKRTVILMGLLALFLGLVINEQSALAQVTEAWVARYNGPANLEDFPVDIAADNTGNAYVTGFSCFMLNQFDLCEPNYTTVKYDSDGNQSWAALYMGGHPVGDAPHALAVDSAGNVYVTGTGYSTALASSYVTIKYDPNGNQLWLARFDPWGAGPSWGESGEDIAVDPMGNVYVTGKTASLTSPIGKTDYGTVKYDTDGNQICTARYAEAGAHTARAIVVDASGNFYVTGNGIYSANSDYVTVKYDANCNQQWASRYDGPGSPNDSANSIAVDSNGNIYVAGYSGTEYATVKYDSNGNQLWAVRGGNNPLSEFVGLAVDGGGNVYVKGRNELIKYDANGNMLWQVAGIQSGSCSGKCRTLALDSSGNVYIRGIRETIGMPPYRDYLTAKYDPNGSLIWEATYNGTGNYVDESTAITVDIHGNVYVTGASPRNVNIPNGYDYATVKYNGVPSLVAIDVTPADPTINVGQTKQFIATGTFSDGSTRVLTSGADSWTSRSPMPSPRGQLAAGVIDGIVYAIGGFFSDPSYITYATLEAYDPSTDSWSPKTPMPTPRSSLGAGVVNGILYAVGGQHNSSLFNTVEAYDPASDSWTTKASLPDPTSEVGVGVVGGILYAVGGYNGGGTSANLEAYDPVTDVWTSKTPMPTPRSGPTVGVVNGILYAIGGNVGQISLTVVEAYNPATDTWTTKAPIPSARCCMGSGVIDGMIYVAGGFNSLAAPSYVNAFEVYDPATDTWTTKDSVPVNVFGNAVGVVNSVLYSIGGFSPGVPPTYDVTTLDDVYAYAPSGEVAWSSLNTGVATIDPIGLATGLGPGVTTITATPTSNPGISGNTTLTVISPTHTLTLGTAGSGSGTVGGAGTYNDGDMAAVAATPDAGSLFVGWMGPDATECATGSVLMNANKSCTANFNLDLPDLIMTAVTPNSATVNQGGTLSASDTVMNQGTMPTGTFRIAYHLSGDNIYGNGDDVVISTIRTVTSLVPGASDSATTSLSIASNAPGGTYHLCALADSIAQVAESNETNNALCSAGTVTLPTADLVMTGVSTPATAVAPGNSLSVSNTVMNQGGFAAGSFRVGFYLSVNADGSTNDVAISTTRTLSSLGAGASSTGTTTLTIPPGTAEGTYYVCAMADSLGQVAESNELNNVLCTASTLQVSLPDLSMTEVTPNSSTVTPGGTLSVTNTVSNGGSASGVFRIAFRLSPDSVYGNTDDVVVTATRVVSSLGAGSSSTGTTNLTIPGSTPLGDYYICALADSLGQVAESDEGNNTLCSGTQVNVQ
jgi:CARDB/Kelch motif/Divergent InlB B-repeat domain/Beta-propeller repeat